MEMHLPNCLAQLDGRRFCAGQVEWQIGSTLGAPNDINQSKQPSEPCDKSCWILLDSNL